jgi:hypothetical protein
MLQFRKRPSPGFATAPKALGDLCPGRRVDADRKITSFVEWR